MINALRQVFSYLVHVLKAFRLHGIHSPFVFQLYNQVVKHTGTFNAFHEIEELRRSLANSPKKIVVTDFGAGSRVKNNTSKTIGQITRYAANPPQLAQFLFRLVNFQQPATILEIGTSLGLTTSYLAAAKLNARVFTLEGCLATSQIAQSNFKKINLKNIHLVTGNFDLTLPALLTKLNTVDFVLFDGNHRLAPTLQYFEWCREKANENSVFVFDDIYWSAEMKKAWQKICAHPEVKLSVDLFYFGLVFFRKNQPKQHFNIRF